MFGNPLLCRFLFFEARVPVASGVSPLTTTYPLSLHNKPTSLFGSVKVTFTSIHKVILSILLSIHMIYYMYDKGYTLEQISNHLFMTAQEGPTIQKEFFKRD